MEKYGLKIVWAARYDYNPLHVLKNHKHNYYQMFYFIDGHGFFWHNTKRLEFQSGDVFFVKADDVHGFTNDTSSVYKTLDIKFYIEDDALLALCNNLKPQYKKASPEIVSLFEKIRMEGMQKNPYYNALADLYLLQIIYFLLRLGNEARQYKEKSNFLTPTAKYSTIAQLVKQYIESNYMQSFTIRDIAIQIGYSESYINKVFKETFQCGIPFYLKTFRIEKAKELISYSEYALKQIALMVGFANIHHFTRVFKELEGTSPGRWLDTEKKGIRKDIYFE